MSKTKEMNNDSMNELNKKIDEMVGKSDRNVSKVYQTSKDLDDIFDQLFRSTGFSRQAAQQFQPYIYQATQAIEDLLTEQVRLGRIDTAKHIFTVLWDEDGAPFQRDDPPREILNYLAELEKGDK